MSDVIYIWEVLKEIFPVALIMGMIAIPMLWIWFNESEEEYEPLDDYYVTSAREQIEKYNTKDNQIDPIDGSKQEL